MPIRPHFITDANEGNEIAWVIPAADADVSTVMSSGVATGEGRSEWCWVRLADGTLILGVFPQGYTYEGLADRAEWGCHPTPPLPTRHYIAGTYIGDTMNPEAVRSQTGRGVLAANHPAAIVYLATEDEEGSDLSW